jgi:hypothetical protein
MSVVKLQEKVQRYATESQVSLTETSFSRLCRHAGAAFAGSEPSPEEKQITAKLFYIIVRQGKSSAATALFKTQSQLRALASVSWEDVDWYAQHPKRSSVSGMYSLLGFPIRNDVARLEKWIDENANNNEKSRLFSCITGMQHGRGVPKEAELNSLKSWCEKNAPDGQWLSLLSSVTGMQCGRGVPKEAELNSLKSWCEKNAP